MSEGDIELGRDDGLGVEKITISRNSLVMALAGSTTYLFKQGATVDVKSMKLVWVLPDYWNKHEQRNIAGVKV